MCARAARKRCSRPQCCNDAGSRKPQLLPRELIVKLALRRQTFGYDLVQIRERPTESSVPFTLQLSQQSHQVVWHEQRPHEPQVGLVRPLDSSGKIRPQRFDCGICKGYHILRRVSAHECM
eukprot:6549646-Prymnesium_polylepis.2